MRAFWDDRYAERDFAYGRDANVFFRETIAAMTPGRLLLPAEGEGRNAVFAASLGWQVEAFDFSPVARIKALQLAVARGVTIDYRIAPVEEVDLPDDTYDLVALIFAHFPAAIRSANHRRLVRTLRPGGTLLVEGFALSQLGKGSGGPKDPSMLYTEEILRDDFSSLEILDLQTLQAELHEGRYHQGEADLLRLRGTRPL